MKYLITKHLFKGASSPIYAIFGRVVDSNQSIAEGWQGITAFALERDKDLVFAHHATFAPDIPLDDDSAVISS